VIKKEGSKYVVRSHQTGRKFGSYKTKAEAVQRLRQMKGHSKKP